MTIEFDEWFMDSPTKGGVLAEQSERSPMFLATRYYMQEAFEAGRESVIANRWTYQKIRAEGVREGMERAAKMLDTNYPLCAKWIRKEIDNER